MLLALAGGLTAAAAERIDFKGLPFGASQADLKKMGATWCRRDDTQLSDAKCMWEDPRQRTYAGHYAPVMDLHFLGKRLDSVRMEFYAATSFGPVRDALQSRYGVGACETGSRPNCSWAINGDTAFLFISRNQLYLVLESREGKPERDARMSRAQERRKKDI